MNLFLPVLTFKTQDHSKKEAESNEARQDFLQHQTGNKWLICRRTSDVTKTVVVSYMIEIKKYSLILIFLLKHYTVIQYLELQRLSPLSDAS